MSGYYYDEYDVKGSYSSSSSRKRSRSRSPHYREKDKEPLKKGRPNEHRDDKGQKIYDSFTDSDDDLGSPAPPPPPMISKVSFGMKKPNPTTGPSTSTKKLNPAIPVKIKLGAPPKKEEVKPKLSVAKAFADEDDDDEVEEMPAECRMRMRNIGRDTPTSSGPNSFGKTKQGFCDSKKIFERNLKSDYS